MYMIKRHMSSLLHIALQWLLLMLFLLPQGSTRIALYGLGSIRDERLSRLFAQAGMVSWWVRANQWLISK